LKANGCRGVFSTTLRMHSQNVFCIILSGRK
jgi:hypothetical protein